MTTVPTLIPIKSASPKYKSSFFTFSIFIFPAHGTVPNLPFNMIHKTVESTFLVLPFPLPPNELHTDSCTSYRFCFHTCGFHSSSASTWNLLVQILYNHQHLIMCCHHYEVFPDYPNLASSLLFLNSSCKCLSHLASITLLWTYPLPPILRENP